MTICRSYCLLLALLAGLLALPTQAQKFPYGENVIDVPAIGDGLSVSNTFQSNMVLQRDKPIYIWGWAEPGDRVTVRFAGNSASTTAGKDRAWKVELPAHKANATPQAMTIKAKAKTLTLDNILVGDVWLLGGQSNMEFELAKVENGNLEIVSANFPEIRILTVPRPIEQNTAKNPGFPRLHQWNPFFKNHDRKGDWDQCTPQIARELSAIGYAFARRVHKASGVPIGVIDASRGGSAIETWVPIDALRAMDSKPVKAMLTQWDKKAADWDAQADLAKRISSHRAYIAKQRKENKPIPANRREEPSDLRPGPAGDYNHPGHLYAGMIGPIKGLSIKGVVFHQGFNNALNGQVGVELYRDVFPEMIRAWRRAFDDKDMPFCILSLCTEGYPQTLDNYAEKMLNAGIEIRAAHYETFLDFHKAGDKHIGFVSTFDLRRRWYHPQVKLPAGERAARWALATQYGFENQVQWMPPMLVSMTKQDGSLLLTLDTKVSDPQDGTIVGFAIAGEDRKFHPAEVAYAETGKNAQGKIQYDKAKLILTSPMVSEPVHFRYAWGRNPLGNLQVSGNKDLPFATQRSDDWPMHTVPLGVLSKDVAIPMSRGDQAKLLNALKQQDKARKLAEAQRIIQTLGQE